MRDRTFESASPKTKGALKSADTAALGRIFAKAYKDQGVAFSEQPIYE